MSMKSGAVHVISTFRAVMRQRGAIYVLAALSSLASHFEYSHLCPFEELGRLSYMLETPRLNRSKRHLVAAFKDNARNHVISAVRAVM